MGMLATGPDGVAAAFRVFTQLSLDSDPPLSPDHFPCRVLPGWPAWSCSGSTPATTTWAQWPRFQSWLFFHQSIVMELRLGWGWGGTVTASCPSSVPPRLWGFILLSHLLWGWNLQSHLAVRDPGSWAPQLPNINIPITDRSLSLCSKTQLHRHMSLGTLAVWRSKWERIL